MKFDFIEVIVEIINHYVVSYFLFTSRVIWLWCKKFLKWSVTLIS